ncbi:MAG: hypothetical protein CMF50_01925 [Legionellales bacterium]|nr:hypothetical protein [Legionellales bacterium]|tara:strand:- start:91042 stop:91461 length:420 start_codon:yes stop_codon:yes gene_type:complete
MHRIITALIMALLSSAVMAGTAICPAVIHCKGNFGSHASCDGIPPQFTLSPAETPSGIYYPERILGESDGPHTASGPSQCFYATKDSKTSLILESHRLVPDSHDIGWHNIGSVPGGKTSYECQMVNHPERCSFALARPE